MPGILEGIKVTMLATYVAAPSAVAILGDWGADIVAIENPLGGDPLRSWTPKGMGMAPAKGNPAWEGDHRNQKSLVLDLTQERGREAAYKLIKGSDVFVTNVREPALKRIKMDYETLKKINPRLIYDHFTGYGNKGPDREKPGFDHAAFWATSGIMATMGEPDGPPPLQRPGMGDHAAGLGNAGAIVAALFARDRHGIGQKVECCLMSLGMWVNGIQITASLNSGQDVQKGSRKEQPNVMRNAYQCKDGRWIQIIVPMNPDKAWPGFCRALGIENVASDPRYVNEQKRAENCRELIEILDKAFAKKEIADLKEAFDKANVVWAQVNTIRDIANSPQAKINNFVQEIDHPELGRIKLVASPWFFSKTPASIRMPGPRLGEHTDEVLKGLGYTAKEIAQLKQEGIAK